MNRDATDNGSASAAPMRRSAARATFGRHPAHARGRCTRGASQVFGHPTPLLRSPFFSITHPSSLTLHPFSSPASSILYPAASRTKHQAPGTRHQAPGTKHQEPSTLHLSGPSTGLRAGFTLIELLTVIAIIGILVTIITGAVQSVVHNRKIAQAKSEVQAIAMAAEEYYRTFREIPLSTNWYTPANPPRGDASDCYFAPGVPPANGENPPATGSPYRDTNRQENYAMARELYDRLTGSNSLGKVFLALQRLEGANSASGALLDPWKKPYDFHLDSDYSGTIYFQRYGPDTWAKIVEKDCIIFVRSRGPNGKVDARQTFGTCSINVPWSDDATWPPVETLE